MHRRQLRQFTTLNNAISATFETNYTFARLLALLRGFGYDDLTIRTKAAYKNKGTKAEVNCMNTIGTEVIR